MSVSSDILISDPSLTRAVDNAIQNELVGMNTAMPGQVVNVYASKCAVDVQPCLQRQYSDGTITPLPIIPYVPLVFPRTSNAWLTFPVAVGDYVMLVFSQRSLEQWLNKGGVVDPQDPRKFAISDAVAIPGVYPFSRPPTVDSANVILQNGTTKITLTPAGKFRFENTGGDEILNLISQLLNTLSTEMVNTMLGPQPLLAASTYASLQSKIDALRS